MLTTDFKVENLFVTPEEEEGLRLPSCAAWGECHSLVCSPSGNPNGVDALFIGFFVDKDVAMRVKNLLSDERGLKKQLAYAKARLSIADPDGESLSMIQEKDGKFFYMDGTEI